MVSHSVAWYCSPIVCTSFPLWDCKLEDTCIWVKAKAGDKHWGGDDLIRISNYLISLSGFLWWSHQDFYDDLIRISSAYQDFGDELIKISNYLIRISMIFIHFLDSSFICANVEGCNNCSSFMRQTSSCLFLLSVVSADVDQMKTRGESDCKIKLHPIIIFISYYCCF